MAVPEATRVLLVDIAVDRRDVVHRLVESPAVGALVVGAVTDAVSAVAAVGTPAPEVVMLEIQLPVEAGLDALAALRRAYPRLPVVVCSFRSDTDTTGPQERPPTSRSPSGRQISGEAFADAASVADARTQE